MTRGHIGCRIGAASIALAIATTAPLARAGLVNVDWGSGVGQTMVLSDNSPITDTTGFTFEIGTFDSYDPTTLMFDEWRTNWNVLHSSGVVESPPTSGQYAFGGATSFTDVDPFAAFAGQDLYIWGYDHLDLNGRTEWVLFTRTGSPDPWVVPTAPVGQTSLDVDFFLSTADTAIKGMIHDSGGAFDIQTMAMGPEPTRALLLLAG
ncbi:MAG: hypothetical protein AAF591_21305, partial [Verrucomicrobiota bacterium]